MKRVDEEEDEDDAEILSILAERFNRVFTLDELVGKHGKPITAYFQKK